MKGEQRGTFRLEQVKSCAGPRINLKQLKSISVEDKIGTVQTNERHDGIQPLERCDHGLLHTLGNRRGPSSSAIAEGIARCRRRPLRAESEHQYVAAIAKQQCGNRVAIDAALKIDVLVVLFYLVSGPDVPTSRTADTLRQPALHIQRRHQRCLWVRNVGFATPCCKFNWVLGARDGFRAVAEKRPSLTDHCQQVGAVLETTAADNTDAIAAVGQSL